MRIFVYEWVTAGGADGAAPGPTLAHEADMMLRSVLADLADLAGVTCLTARWSGLPPIARVETLTTGRGESALELFRRGVAAAEWVWPTAPEQGGVLERLARVSLEAGRGLLGTRPDTVRLTASKQATAAHLAAAGIPVVATYTADPGETGHDGAWVVKPDDGAGAEGVRFFPDRASATAELARRGPGHILQPWVEGVPSSLSLLCGEGRASVLACNRQQIRVTNGSVTLVGLGVNREKARVPHLAPLADRIAAALPGLWGYVGVDLVLTAAGPVVLEINPRLTTSWCGLRRSLGQNPAAWVVQLARTGTLPTLPSPLMGGAVDLDLEPAGVR